MKIQFALCASALAACLVTGCTPAAPPAAPDTHDADVKAIQDTEVAANKAWAAKDATGVANFYTDDAVLMVGGADAVQGKAAIGDALKHMLADPALSLTFHSTSVVVAKSGDVGYSVGPYELTVTDPVSKKPVHDHGTYVTTFIKQPDGTWKASVDAPSSAVPPMPAPKKH